MMNNDFLKASLMTGTDVDTLLRQYFIPDKFTGEDEIEYLNFRKNWDLMAKEMTELHYSGLLFRFFELGVLASKIVRKPEPNLIKFT